VPGRPDDRDREHLVLIAATRKSSCTAIMIVPFGEIRALGCASTGYPARGLGPAHDACCGPLGASACNLRMPSDKKNY